MAGATLKIGQTSVSIREKTGVADILYSVSYVAGNNTGDVKATFRAACIHDQKNSVCHMKARNIAMVRDLA